MMPETRRRTHDQAWASAPVWGRKPLAFRPRGCVARIYVCQCGTQAVVSDGEPPMGWKLGEDDRYYCPPCWQGRAA